MMMVKLARSIWSEIMVKELVRMKNFFKDGGSRAWSLKYGEYTQSSSQNFFYRVSNQSS
jgi:hypothetical protein